VLTQVEFGGTDEVSDVFDDKQIDPGKVKGVKSYLDHVAVEVASAIGVYLHGLDPLGLDALGVVG